MSDPSRLLAGMFALLLFPSDPIFAQTGPGAEESTSKPAAGGADSSAIVEKMGGNETPDSARPGLYFFNKAVKAFEKGQYTFAIEMYEVAASYAYKPAQFNLAVMYAQGQGVPANLPRALAWAALAAERNDKHYVAARNAISAALAPKQVDEAELLLKELMPKYADDVAMKRAKSRWKDAKLVATGSRLGFVGGLKVGDPGNIRGTSQKHEITDQTSASVGTTVSDVLGGKQIDGSIVYRELLKTNSPYDARLEEQTGVVKVGDLEAKPGEPPASTAEPAEH